MQRTLEKLHCMKSRDSIGIMIAGHTIWYALEQQGGYYEPYAPSNSREYDEYIEEMQSIKHDLKLKNSDWQIQINGRVDFEAYQEKEEGKEGASLFLRFHYLDAGRMIGGDKDVRLGEVYASENGLKLVTDDGKEHIIP